LWRVYGYDTYDGRPYDFLDHPLYGFSDEEEALRFAREQFANIQYDQPPEEAGHCWEEDSIQDQVWIVRPDGSEYQFQP